MKLTVVFLGFAVLSPRSLANMDTGFLQLLVIFISTKASEITVRKYEKLDNLILDDYILSKFANNVSSKLKCALLCAEQDCGCVSYVFEKSTKTCRMYSDKFSPQPSGGVTGYVDRSGKIGMRFSF